MTLLSNKRYSRKKRNLPTPEEVFIIPTTFAEKYPEILWQKFEQIWSEM